ncbi:uncharacterized protein LOC108471557 [Gossypium arboreum]|uniref:uncharacterized protein LOC108471557 n=1 Tax=Gossypium arboreum TaxID=29729 RepID=UPI0008190018|nr:uncharacterized protein LOC108471557 [Gossypium arboreum]
MQGRRRPQGGTRAESFSMGSVPNLETNETVSTLNTETESQTPMAGDDTLSQAMIRALEGIIGVAPIVAEYWLEATEHIMIDLNYTPIQKLRGVVSLLWDEAYQWWLTIVKSAQLEQEGLRYDLQVLIAAQREWVFAILVDKAKIVEEVKRIECERRDCEKDQNKVKRDSGPSGSVQRPKKWARLDKPSRPETPAVGTKIQQCIDCKKCHPGGAGRGQRALGRGACQAEARQLALVYTGRCHEESNDADVIAGTFFIHSILYYALIDIGSTHSYIASVVFVTLGLTAKNTAREFSVISLLGQSIQVDGIYKRVPLELQANKLVRKGCEAYLGYVSDSTPKKLSVGDIHTMREFSNIFPEEFPRVPLDREVEFGIDLLPVTAVVSIVPYLMAPKELIELKAQLQELLDRGFI